MVSPNSSAADRRSDALPVLKTWFMADHATCETTWLWHNRIPLGGLTLITRSPERDASALVADLAARVTVGGPFPGTDASCEATGLNAPGRVVVVSAAGDPRSGIARQIEQSGGKRDRLLVINGVADPAAKEEYDFDRPLSLPADLSLLRQTIVDWNSVDWNSVDGSQPAGKNCVNGNSVNGNKVQAGPVRLLVIDSLPIHVGRWREAEMRTLCDRLNRLAVDLDLAVVLVSPLATDPSRLAAGKTPLAKCLGSAALVESAGAIWQMRPTADDLDRLELIPLKSRMKSATAAFRVQEDAVQWELPTSATRPLAVPVTRGPEPLGAKKPASKSDVHSSGSPAKQIARETRCESLQSSRDATIQFPDSQRNMPVDSPNLRDGVVWSPGGLELVVLSSLGKGVAEVPQQPAVESPPRGPQGKSAASLRQSPEWKQASRGERKRLLREAANTNSSR